MWTAESALEIEVLEVAERVWQDSPTAAEIDLTRRILRGVA